MNPFQQMTQRVHSSPYRDQFLKLCAPLKDHLGINQFGYHRITRSGHYSYFGTHTAWDDLVFENTTLDEWQSLIRPLTVGDGLQLFSFLPIDNEPMNNILRLGWDKCKTHPVFYVQKQTLEGIEGYSVGTSINDPRVTGQLLNQLPMFDYFVKTLKEKHRKVFHLLDDYPVDLPALFGLNYLEPATPIQFPQNHTQFLYELGLGDFLKLNAMEVAILKLISVGYPAAYIGKQLRLKTRTVEKYVGVIKEKLSCSTRIQLIHKAQVIKSTGYFKE